MLTQPEPACLVIADISGYTGFLAGAEIDHAELAIQEAIRPGLDLTFREGLAALTRVIDEVTASQSDITVAPEPDVPGSLGRNVREPIAQFREAGAAGSVG